MQFFAEGFIVKLCDKIQRFPAVWLNLFDKLVQLENGYSGDVYKRQV